MITSDEEKYGELIESDKCPIFEVEMKLIAESSYQEYMLGCLIVHLTYLGVTVDRNEKVIGLQNIIKHIAAYHQSAEGRREIKHIK